MTETAKPDFPEEFVQYAKQKVKDNKEYVSRMARFGSPMLREWAQMILAAAGGEENEDAG